MRKCQGFPRIIFVKAPIGQGLADTEFWIVWCSTVEGKAANQSLARMDELK